MSFASGVKDELASLPLGDACCLLAELAGITLASGSMRLAGGGVEASIATESPAIARRVYRIVHALYGVRARIEQRERRRLNRNLSYRVVVEGDAPARRLLTDIGVLGAGGVTIGIRDGLVRLSCCQGAFIRGLFLGCGSMSDPGKGYHLELVLEDEQLARGAAALLAGADIEARVVRRADRHVVYIKEADRISGFLVLAGAHASMLRFEGIRVEKGVRNSVNRIVNCDTANVDKAVRASGRQLDSIRLIARRMGLNRLPAGLREAADARLENPDVPLGRLSELMGVSKSGLNHRFSRLEEIADEIRMKEGTMEYAEEAHD